MVDQQVPEEVIGNPKNMEYVRLGNSGLKISKIILGAMSYGSSKWQQWVLDEGKALPLLEHAYKVGINTWDTADMYSNGKSEEIFGKALQKYSIPRSKVVILTKCFYGVADSEEIYDEALSFQNDGEMVNQIGLSRKHIFDAVDGSVKRLGTYIDVLQIHRLDPDTPREEIMKALNDVVESGRVRYIGASSMAAWEFQSLQNIAASHGWHKFISMQNYYNLLYREEEREMIPYCRDTGVGIIPWSPIAAGVLARPFGAAGTMRATTSTVDLPMQEVDRVIVQCVQEVADKNGVSMATIATAWCLSKPGVNPIVGMSSIARIDQAVEASHYHLSQEDAAYLEEAYRPKAVKGY